MSIGNILITGASSGIGKACALYLSQNNYHVFAGVLNEVEAEKLRPLIDSEKVNIVTLDVTNINSIHETCYLIQKEAPQGLDAIINNAGIAVCAPNELIPLNEYKRQFDVNFFGTIGITQEFLPLLRLKKGRIINFSSIAGRVYLPSLAPYCASKFAIEAYTDVLRMELKNQGIEVVLIEPGSVRTNIWNTGIASIEKISHDSPDSTQKYYDDLSNTMKNTLNYFNSHSIDPTKVANIILKALKANRPKTRYMVGWDAKMLNLLRILPDRLRDKVVFLIIMILSSNSREIKKISLKDLKLSGKY